MILPPRGAPVDTNRRTELRGALDPQEVVQRIDKLIDRDQVRLTEIFSDDDVHPLCDELETSVDLMWIVLSATSRLVRDRARREEPRELKRQNQSKYPKLKKPRPSRARRITVERVKPPEKPSVHAIRAHFRFSWHSQNNGLFSTTHAFGCHHNASKIHHSESALKKSHISDCRSDCDRSTLPSDEP